MSHMGWCSICILFVVISLVSNCNAQGVTYDVTYTDSANGGMKYDLSPLRNTTQDYVAKWDVYTGYLNVGITLSTASCIQYINVTVCQTWTPTGKAKLGALPAKWGPITSAYKDKYQYGVQVTFGNGDSGRSTNITFVCNSSATTKAPPVFIAEPGTEYQFLWVSAYACPSNRPSGGGSGGLSGGSIILIIVLCVMVVYLAAGITFQKVKNNASGLELIPNVEFWSSLPGLVRDGILFIVNKTCRRGGYQQV